MLRKIRRNYQQHTTGVRGNARYMEDRPLIRAGKRKRHPIGKVRK